MFNIKFFRYFYSESMRRIQINANKLLTFQKDIPIYLFYNNLI